MPRRPSKKSRVAGQNARSSVRKGKRDGASVKRWERADDIPMDEEDQFHLNKDRILLEGEEEHDDSDGDEDEVFALEGMDELSEDDDEDVEVDEDQVLQENEDEEMEDVVAPRPSKSKRKAKGSKAKPSSDSEEENSEEEEESWGRNKSAYYASNADQIDSDDEEANEMEEQEARRLQRRAREPLDDADFGLDTMAAAAAQVSTDADGMLGDVLEPETPTAPQLPQDKDSILRYLEKNSPETLALARDWDEVAHSVVRSQEKLEKMANGPNADALSMGMVHLYHQALLSYTTTLAFYLHLRASPKYAAKPEALRNHPIFPRLLTLKSALATLEELDFALSDDEDEDEDEDEGGEGLDMGSPLKKRLDAGELEALLRDAEGIWDEEEVDSGKDVEKPDEEDQETLLALEPPKKKVKLTKAAPVHVEPIMEKKKKKSKTAAAVFDLVEPDYVPSRPSVSPSSTSLSTSAGADAYGEATALASADAEDKRARRRTLQFYTSKLDSAAARREGARRAAGGGDDDIPYKARKQEARAKQAKETAALRPKGDDLDGSDAEGENGPGGAKRDDGGSEDESEGDGYYELVKAGKKAAKAAKAAKQAEYDASRETERAAHDADESTDGPRSISRAILKNKGLTPRRSKSVRNPRVKKRNKFEAAQKKLRSQRAVHKPGAGDASRYEGERSGISRVVKSVRLS